LTINGSSQDNFPFLFLFHDYTIASRENRTRQLGQCSVKSGALSKANANANIFTPRKQIQVDISRDAMNFPPCRLLSIP
jgi:hypothetical protein